MPRNAPPDGNSSRPSWWAWARPGNQKPGADDRGSDAWLNLKASGVLGLGVRELPGDRFRRLEQVVVKDAGDFKVGQGVMLSKCNPHYTLQMLWGPTGAIAWGGKLNGKAEIRGYDGSQGDWVVLVLNLAKGSTAFRWSDDLARTPGIRKRPSPATGSRLGTASQCG